MKEEVSENKLKEGNISLILDSYEDIFSSFDPRHYSERALSDDFLVECKRASAEKDEDFELRLLVPHGKRNLNHEKEILFRLKDHFNKHFKREERKVIHTKREGIAWFLVGTVLMIIATFVSGKEEFIMKLVETMLIPAGWFMFWEGLSKVFITSRENFPDYGFYNRIKNARVKFFSY
jgi:hypothetical protein